MFFLNLNVNFLMAWICWMCMGDWELRGSCCCFSLLFFFIFHLIIFSTCLINMYVDWCIWRWIFCWSDDMYVNCNKQLVCVFPSFFQIIFFSNLFGLELHDIWYGYDVVGNFEEVMRLWHVEGRWEDDLPKSWGWWWV